MTRFVVGVPIIVINQFYLLALNLFSGLFLLLLPADFFLLPLDLSFNLPYLLLLVDFFLLALGLSPLVALERREREIIGRPRQIFPAELRCVLAIAKLSGKRSQLKIRIFLIYFQSSFVRNRRQEKKVIPVVIFLTAFVFAIKKPVCKF